MTLVRAPVRPMTNSPVTRVLACAFVSLAAAGLAIAYDYREDSLAQKVANATLVVIARASSLSPGAQNEPHATAGLTIEQTLKGKSTPVISVITDSDIAEADPNCCEKGARYLMFLHRTAQGQYYSVNGRFGIYRLDAPAEPTTRTEPRP
jgi:hypothetical protein